MMQSFVNYYFLSGIVISLMPISITFIPVAIAQSPANRNTETSEATYPKDIQTHWAKKFIQGLANRNLIAKSQNFQPDRQVTHAEFAVIIDQAFPFQPSVNQAIAYGDVPSDFWAATAIQNAYKKGFATGNNNLFRPNQFIKRSEAMVAIANGLSILQNYKVDPKVSLYATYIDAGIVPESAIAPIATLTDRQIVVNYPSVRQINPNANITRAELSALIYQSLVYLGQLPKINSNLIASSSNRLSNTNDFAPNLVGQEIITRLKVNLRRREVVAFQGNKKLKTYPLGVGRAGWETPSGKFQVKQIIRNPDWKNPFTGDVIKAGDPDNPLNGYWIGFWTNGKDWSGFHGTAQRESVGKASSHGCLRMYKEDIKAIFTKVTPGTIVEVLR